MPLVRMTPPQAEVRLKELAALPCLANVTDPDLRIIIDSVLPFLLGIPELIGSLSQDLIVNLDQLNEMDSEEEKALAELAALCHAVGDAGIASLTKENLG
jgi:hypothetical protein